MDLTSLHILEILKKINFFYLIQKLNLSLNDFKVNLPCIPRWLLFELRAFTAILFRSVNENIFIRKNI